MKTLIWLWLQRIYYVLIALYVYRNCRGLWRAWRRTPVRCTWPALTGTQIDMTDGEEFDFLLRENWTAPDRLLPRALQFPPLPVYVKRTSPTTVTLGFVPWPHLYAMRWPVAGGKVLP
jgi:hypothetical protein